MNKNFDNFILKCKKYFPNFDIGYKNQSTLMKIIGYIFFFNKSFMTKYITTIGSTIYFPAKSGTPDDMLIVLHELIHINDAKKYNKLLFGWLYLLPQSLILFALPVFFFNWWVALILMTVCLLPLPAYFRMKFELKAYKTSLYVQYKYAKKRKFLFYDNSYFIESQFTGAGYYFMWPFGVEKEIDAAVKLIKDGQHPYEDDIFYVIDELIELM